LKDSAGFPIRLTHPTLPLLPAQAHRKHFSFLTRTALPSQRKHPSSRPPMSLFPGNFVKRDPDSKRHIPRIAALRLLSVHHVRTYAHDGRRRDETSERGLSDGAREVIGWDYCDQLSFLCHHLSSFHHPVLRYEGSVPAFGWEYWMKSLFRDMGHLFPHGEGACERSR
jgi:hypothetical protein